MKDRQRWQLEEDALLRAYVKQYGPKEWNLISQRIGKSLDRDPKSCLERWKNYLKPGIKKGSLTPAEQSLVISLQAKYGNKWKKIVAEVLGCTAKRLGKWWEVFKEKQLKQLHKSQNNRQEYDTMTARPAVVAGGTSPEKAAQGKYNHILETFVEKYVQPKMFAFQSPNIIIPNVPLPEPPPVLFLGSSELVQSGSLLPPPPWMNMSNRTSTETSSLTSSSSTPSPSVSFTLSPPESAVLDPEIGLPSRSLPVHQMGTLVQCCKELEEGRQNWLQHKKEATWWLSRLEQQLESEKARKRREKIEETEAKMRTLIEEEVACLSRIEGEYREQQSALRREAETKEMKLMEAWCGKHAKLAKLVEPIGGGHGCRAGASDDFQLQ